MAIATIAETDIGMNEIRDGNVGGPVAHRENILDGVPCGGQFDIDIAVTIARDANLGVCANSRYLHLAAENR